MRNSERAALVAGLIVAGSFIPLPVSAADDTFSCLSRLAGPNKIVRNAGAYTNYIVGDYQPGTRFDARDAWWRHQTFPNIPEQNGYLIQLGSTGPVREAACWAGGHIVGTTDRNTPWYRLKSGSDGAGIMINGNGVVIDGIRMDNVFGESGILVRKGRDFDIRNVWVSHIVDDCIENDGKERGRISDSLFDGCFMGLSIDNRHESARPENTIVLDGVLMHLREVDMTNRPYDTWGTWFKTRATSRGEVGLKVYDSVLTFSDTTPVKYANRVSWAWQWMRDCRNNVIAWLPDGPLPADFPTPPACFRIETGQAARDLWAAAKQNWINCHPMVARAPHEPRSDVSSCDPNAYGGGDTVTHPLPLPRGPQLLAYVSKRAGVVPVVDGNLEEFQNAPSTTLGDHTLYALWEADALYLAVNIVDDRLDVSIATRDGDLWTEDSLEVFIDPERDRGSRMTGGDRQFVVNARGTQLDADGAGTAWDGEWRAAVRATATGYDVELGIPWSTLGIDPEAGAGYGFSFAINDKDGETQTQMLWGGADSGFRVPDNWGTLTLSDDPVAERLAVTGHTAKDVTDSIAVIEWSLSDAADGFVEYGPTTAYGSRTRRESSFLSLHRQRITNLSPATAYFYRINSSSEAGASASAAGTFNTKP